MEDGRAVDGTHTPTGNGEADMSCQEGVCYLERRLQE